jgi:tRNA U55 pseudouridine synthase TruB
MSQLRRTRSGLFSIAQAHDLDRLDNVRLVAMEEATRLPQITASDEHLTMVRNGLQLPPASIGIPPEAYERAMLLSAAGKLVAVVHVDTERNKTVYDRVFGVGPGGIPRE